MENKNAFNNLDEELFQKIEEKIKNNEVPCSFDLNSFQDKSYVEKIFEIIIKNSSNLFLNDYYNLTKIFNLLASCRIKEQLVEDFYRKLTAENISVIEGLAKREYTYSLVSLNTLKPLSSEFDLEKMNLIDIIYNKIKNLKLNQCLKEAHITFLYELIMSLKSYSAFEQLINKYRFTDFFSIIGDSFFGEEELLEKLESKKSEYKSENKFEKVYKRSTDIDYNLKSTLNTEKSDMNFSSSFSNESYLVAPEIRISLDNKEMKKAVNVKSENNNNKIHEKTIEDLNKLKESISALKKIGIKLSEEQQKIVDEYMNGNEVYRVKPLNEKELFGSFRSY